MRQFEGRRRWNIFGICSDKVIFAVEFGQCSDTSVEGTEGSTKVAVSEEIEGHYGVSARMGTVVGEIPSAVSRHEVRDGGIRREG